MVACEVRFTLGSVDDDVVHVCVLGRNEFYRRWKCCAAEAHQTGVCDYFHNIFGCELFNVIFFKALAAFVFEVVLNDNAHFFSSAGSESRLNCGDCSRNTCVNV